MSLPPPPPHARRSSSGSPSPAVLAIMLASLGLVLLKSSQASRRLRARDRVEDRASRAPPSQAAGTRQQQASQALYVATGERATSASGRRASTPPRSAGAAVEELHDPKVDQDRPGRDRRPTASTTRPSTTSSSRRWQRGDTAAAHAALLLADKYVRVPLQAQEKIGAYVSQRQAAGHRRREGRVPPRAQRFGLLAGLLATLLAAVHRRSSSAAASAAPPRRCSTA